jgi:FAD synthetase
MSLEKLVLKYVASAEHVLSQVEIAESCVSVDANRVKKVVESAKTYLEDAKYYKEKNRLEVSLASVAYCEGLLDALKLLGAVKFEWSVKEKKSGK